MAISEPHYRALKLLVERGEIERGCALLEIGEANWYGEIEPPFPTDSQELFAIAKDCYRSLFAPSHITSVDMGGTANAQKFDLNYSYRRLLNPPLCDGVEETETFGLIINHGTAEHIFNIANVFGVMHDHCKVGGLMIHESPFTGWVEHGFYCLQPTLFYDLAAANGYDIRFIAIEHIELQLLMEITQRDHFHELARRSAIPQNSMLYVAMRKTKDAEFAIPQQGVYDKKLTEEGMKAWKEVR